MKRIATALLALFVASTATGCVTRTIVSFEDNQKAPVTALALIKDSNYFVYRKAVLQFYLCQDTGNQLVCKLSCDGPNDVVCVAAAAGGGVVTTNIR